MGKLSNYRVWLRSKPGMYEQYGGYVDVVAPNAKQAEEAAFAKLRRTYPNRSRGMWVVKKIERRNCLAP
jgi:hypothetical protein